MPSIASSKVIMITTLSQRKVGPWKRDFKKKERNKQHFMTDSSLRLAPVIKAYRTGYQTIPTILKRYDLSNCSRLLNASTHITFWMLHVRANFVSRLFHVSLSFWGHSAKKRCLRFAIFNFSEKLQNIFKMRLKKYGVFVPKSLVCCLCVNLPTFKIWEQSDKFPLSFSFLQCLLQEKTVLNMSIRWVIFTFGQNLKPPFLCQYLNLFQWLLFYIRDFIWIIIFTEKSKFEENCRSEGIL